MKLVTAAQMRDLDRRTVEEANVKGAELMERAGQGVADIVRRLAEVSGFVNPAVHLIAGRGNNGGDAFVAARSLKASGCAVEVWLACHANQIGGDAFIHYNKMIKAGIKAIEVPTVEDWQAAIDLPYFADIIVDGVLGTGINGPARGPAAGAIQYINAQGNDELVVAIDVPSGLDADTGRAGGEAVRADITATMGLPKLGLLEPAAADYVGALDVIDIGIPREFIEDLDLETDDEFIHSMDLKNLFPRRNRAAHKGLFGHVLLIGGAQGYAGSIALSARAALRSGAGLVSVLTPRSIQPIVAGAALEAMVMGGAETETGSLDPIAWEAIKPRLTDFTALLVGPGLTCCDATKTLVRKILAESPIPLVFDADALNALAGEPELIAAARVPVIITPHPGEMARLIVSDIPAVQKDRRAAARTASRRAKAVTVLKGAGTIVTTPSHPLHINMTGNPGMATGGTGDALAGLITGLLGQGFKPFDAARAGVFVHGRAGDIAAYRKCQISVIASDVIDELPFSFRELSLR